MIPESTSRRKPATGLTPLIDVVFILLIFFMLVVQFSEYQQVPMTVVTTTTAPVQDNQDNWIITLNGDGACRLRQTDLSCEAALSALPDSLANPVVLGMADTAKLGDAIDLQTRLIERGYEVSFGLAGEAPQP
ncbi:ExbD/TolR family protein [Maricaulis salignorans]|uniref:Outer membrane transport energization protein ExbD n=1 Tax=Maricaulis salignorans TaxID=144026 RepID=A0A1G9TL47_9PROT|nr:biopolymer transporter ExbD [Maricaulis salignorans]SDM48421.1 outer membrane transport energization protein ExbD [Maricaulis salignorans]